MLVDTVVRVLLFACLAVFGSRTARAEPARAITFDEAIGLAARSPEASGAAERLAARRRGDRRIGRWAGTTQATFMPGGIVSPPSSRGFEMQANATHTWSPVRTAARTRSAARAERATLGARARAEALRERIEAARLWIELFAVERQRRLLDERVAVAQARVRATVAAVEHGVARRIDADLARAEHAALASEALELEGRQAEIVRRLAEAIGRPERLDLVASGPLPAPNLPPDSTLRGMLREVDALPEVAASRIAVTAARARRAEARARTMPQLVAGAQVERSAADDWTLYGIVGVQFAGTTSRGRTDATYEEAIAAATNDLERVRVAARAEIERILHDLDHARRTLTLVEDHLLPAATDLRARLERAVARGEETIHPLLDARMREIEARTAHIRARADLAWASVRAWLLLQEMR